jgi:hypothetical protein
MKLRPDKLLVSTYALHGDMCSLAPHCKTLGCASRLGSDEYVLVARFAYLQEAIEYCQEGARRGVNMRLISRICKPLYISNYAPQIALPGVQS